MVGSDVHDIIINRRPSSRAGCSHSPNDLVVKRDGTVWFTDPTYGLGKHAKEQTANHVFCFDPKTHELRAVVQ